MKRTIASFLLGIFAFFLGLAFLAGALYWSLPNVEAMRGCLTTEMFKVNLCPKGEGYVRLNQISPFLKNAILISEDSAFYSHNGFDLDEIRLSFEKNLSTGTYKRGGSTITQQLVKNVFLTKEKTLFRKFKEAILTVQVEKRFSKDQILERYLNVVQFGKDMYGVKAAAHFYFQKEPLNLNILESAFLAMLLPNPIKYSQSYHKGSLTHFARARIVDITYKLHSVKRISDQEFESAKAQLDGFPWNRVDEIVMPTDPADPISEPDEAPEDEY